MWDWISVNGVGELSRLTLKALNYVKNLANVMLPTVRNDSP